MPTIIRNGIEYFNPHYTYGVSQKTKFTPMTNGLQSVDVQAAIEEVYNLVAGSFVHNTLPPLSVKSFTNGLVTSNNVLTLPEGMTVVIANGVSGGFVRVTEYTTGTDISMLIPDTILNVSGKYLVFLNTDDNEINLVSLDNYIVSTKEPSENTDDTVWYDVENVRMRKWSIDKWLNYNSVPVGTVTIENGLASSVSTYGICEETDLVKRVASLEQMVKYLYEKNNLTN